MKKPLLFFCFLILLSNAFAFWYDAPDIFYIRNEVDLNGGDINVNSVETNFLTVNSDSNFFGDVGIDGNLYVLGNITFYGDINVTGDFDVNGVILGTDSNFINIGISQGAFVNNLFGIGDFNFSNNAWGNECTYDASIGSFLCGGENLVASGAKSIALGQYSVATGAYSGTVYGFGSEATADYTLAGGWESKASANHSIALGSKSTASGLNSVAIGSGAKATALYGVAIGNSVLNESAGVVALGTDANVQRHLWIGGDINGLNSSFYGINKLECEGCSADGIRSTGLGYVVSALGDYSTAIGYVNSANGLGSVALGYVNGAFGDYSFVVGKDSRAYGSASAAIGNGLSVYDDNTLLVQDLNVLGNATFVGNIATTGDSNFANIGVSNNYYSTGNITTTGTLGAGAITGTSVTTGLTTDLGVYTTTGGLLTTTAPTSGVLGYWSRTGTVLSPSNAGDDITTTGTGTFGTTTGLRGAGSFASGLSVEASGDYSFATGSGVTAGGIGSFASGKVTGGEIIASGQGSTAMGYAYEFRKVGLIQASGTGSIAMGYGTSEGIISSGTGSIAMGYQILLSSGTGSVAMGRISRATNDASIALGYGTTASGVGSVALGYTSTASSNGAIAMGFGCEASGYGSLALGHHTLASTSYSTAMGSNTIAESYVGTAIGRYNVGGGTAGGWVATDPLFELGIGASDGARANALTIYKNGNANFHAGNITTTGTGTFGDLNVTGDIDAFDGNVNGNVVLGTAWYSNLGGESVAFTVKNTWYKFNMATNNRLNGFHIVDGNFQAEVDGLYRIDYTAEGEGANNHLYITTILVNDANQDSCNSYETMPAANDIRPMDSFCYLDIRAGDYITLAVMDWTGTETGTVYNYDIAIERKGKYGLGT